MKTIELFQKMLSEYGKQNWWPVTEQGEKIPTYKPRKNLSEKQKFEIAIGAILTQNTNWKNVEKAIMNLNKAKMLDCEKIADAPLQKIALLIKPSGYYNQKAKKIKIFSQYLRKNYSRKIEKLFAKKEIFELREELLSLHGIGQETADSIILYAAQKPVFVIDAYTKRFLDNFFGIKASYSEAQKFFESQLPREKELFSEFHAFIVEHAKQYCRKKPLCEQCFLKSDCKKFNM